MNFQEKLFESTADLRARAETIAQTAAKRAEQRFETLRGSFDVLNTAGREFNKVARRHAIEFVKQNSSIASKVRDDVSTLARTTFASLTRKPAARTARKAGQARTASKAGLAAPARKRARKAA
jgi:hypothetical protein